MNKQNIKSLYTENKDLIEKVMSEAMSQIFDELENADLDLSTDENQSVCLKLMKMWIDNS